MGVPSCRLYGGQQTLKQATADFQRLGGCLIRLLPLQQAGGFLIEVDPRYGLHVFLRLTVDRRLGGLCGIDLLGLAADTGDQRTDCTVNTDGAAGENALGLLIGAREGVAIVAGTPPRSPSP